MNAPADLTINRLRCPLPARQPVVARLALEALAAEVAEAPAGQPPQSLLVVRQLALEVPGLNLARLPDSAQRQAAARGAGSLLADAWAQAARPALGEVSPQANAVRFGDPAELLACIARDGLAGRLDRWWWRALLGLAFPDWRQAWARHSEAAPAALRLLAREGLESAVRQALDNPAMVVAEVEIGMTSTTAPPALLADRGRRTATGLPPMASPDSTVRSTDAAPPAHGVPAAESAATAQPSLSAHTTARARLLPAETTRPRPLAALPTDDPAPSAEARPHAASAIPPAATPAITPSPAAAVLAPRRVAAMTHAVPPHQAANVGTPPAAEPSSPPAAAAAGTAAAPSKLEPAVPPPAFNAARSARPASAPTPATFRGTRRSAEIGHLLADGDRLRPPPSEPAPRPGAAIAPAPSTNPTDATGWSLDATPIPVRSRHARLFFLVNLLLGDGLYPDFTQPATAGFPVPIWRLLALLGSGLAGPALRDDPLWALLDRLAGELPSGEDRAFARDWPIPAALAQGPRPARTAAPAIRPRTLRHARAQGFARWLAAYRHSLRQRLAAALGLAPALLGRAFVEDDSAALIWVSAAEIVVVQPLDEHPVAWRLAGLDRDPGFLPSAGRSLLFIFE